MKRLVGPASGAKRLDDASTASGDASTKKSHPGKRAKPACIAALNLDAGTSFVLRTDPRAWRAELREAFSNAPPGKSIVMVETAPATYAEAQLGAGAAFLKLYFRHTAYVILDARSGRIEVQTKAEALWALGLEEWGGQWLGWLSYASGGVPCSVRTAYAAGWRTQRVELCSDFVHLPVRRNDAGRFSTHAKPHTIEKLHRGERLDVYGRFDGFVETLAIGKRSDRSSMSVHAKSRQLLKVKKVAPDRSIYAPTWRQAPAYAPDAPITRVELRFSGKGLRFTSKAGPLDLSDPAALLDRATLARVWASETNRRRLVVGRATRKYRNDVDPRWRVVQGAAGIAPARLLQDRSVQRRTWDDLLRTSERKLVREAQTIADLHGVRTSNIPLLRHVAALAVGDAAAHISPRELEERKRRLGALHEFVEAEAEAARPALMARIYGASSEADDEAV